jgi:hypothetical protein
MPCLAEKSPAWYAGILVYRNTQDAFSLFFFAGQPGVPQKKSIDKLFFIFCLLTSASGDGIQRPHGIPVRPKAKPGDEATGSRSQRRLKTVTIKSVNQGGCHFYTD